MGHSIGQRITPRWLKLKDAAAYSAIGERRLIALAEEGLIRGFRDPDNGRRDWIFDRESLDAYREGQLAEEYSRPVHARYLEIMNERKRKGKV